MSGAARRQVGRAEASALLLDAPRVACLTHERSDGDALSALALAAVLKALGKAVWVFHELPSHYAWVLPTDPALAPAAALPPDAFLVTLDVAHYARVAWPEPERSRVRALLREYPEERVVPLDRYDAIRPVDLVIDHHVTNRGFGRANWIEPARSAVAEMTLDLILEWEAQTGQDLLTPEVARWLMVGLVTSTGWFQRDTGPDTFRAAELLDRRGRLDKTAMADRLRAETVGYFRLAGHLRQTAALEDGVAHVYVDRELLTRYGVTSTEAANFIDELLALPADVYVLFVEMEQGGIRVRLRSHRTPVHTLAAQFGGGGHERASGTVLQTREEAERLVAAAKALVRESR